MLGSIATLLFTILAKKIIFSDESHFDLGGYVNKQNCRIWGTENSRAYIEKPNVERIFVHRNCRGGYWQHLVSTALRTTQPKLHSKFYALILKIALSAAELMSFGHLVAAI